MNRRLQIVSSATAIGGGELSLIQLASELFLKGWRISLCAPPHNLQLQRKMASYIDDFIPLTFLSIFQQFLKSFYKSDQIFYANGYVAAKNLVLMDPLHRFPHVVHLRESEYGPFSTWKANFILKNMDFCIAISKSVKSEVLKRTNLADEKIVVVPNGVPQSEFSKSKECLSTEVKESLGIPPDSPVITMAGRTDALKGHYMFLDSIPLISKSHPEAHFLIIGLDSSESSALAKSLHNLIDSSPFRQNIHTLPFIHNTRYFIAGSTILVVPSISEGFGRVAIEAMMECTPVVASRVGGLGEIFEDKTEGLYVSPNNPHELTQACLFLLDSSTQRLSIASSGLSRALADYQISKTAGNVSSLFESHLDAEF